ncbi:MAG TPA: dTDP-glucose 4,6-dehydratase [Thermodesulfobacteriaceae bacterium]|nr:dTDP-glucose 4,6-dehydratase [Thermodesulfobacteriaceae bacterium]
MRKMLVTGGAGFIGANFVHYWTRHHPEDRLTVLDSLTYAGNLENLRGVKDHPGFSFIRGDICDQALVEQILRERTVDTIVHFAAESHVDRSIHGPDEFIRTNITGTHSLLKAARQVWLEERSSGRKNGHRFHHVSTDEVYGSLGPDDPAFTEKTPYAPNSPYAASKAASDHLVRAYHHTYGLDVTTSNCSNNYGPYQFPEKLIPLMLINILAGKPLPVYGDGLNIRDWLHVEDHCRGIELILKKGRPGEVYNIGGNTELTNIEIIRILCSLLDRKIASDEDLRKRFPDSPAAVGKSSTSLISYVKDRPGHDRRYAIDPSKTMAELGYMPEITFEKGLRDTLMWYLENEAWWRSILDGTYRQWIRQQYGRGRDRTE